jgi:hypothetical protein
VLPKKNKAYYQHNSFNKAGFGDFRTNSFSVGSGIKNLFFSHRNKLNSRVNSKVKKNLEYKTDTLFAYKIYQSRRRLSSGLVRKNNIENGNFDLKSLTSLNLGSLHRNKDFKNNVYKSRVANFRKGLGDGFITDNQRQWNFFQLVAGVGLFVCLIMVYQIGNSAGETLPSLNRTAISVNVVNDFSDKTLGKQTSSITALTEITKEVSKEIISEPKTSKNKTQPSPQN